MKASSAKQNILQVSAEAEQIRDGFTDARYSIESLRPPWRIVRLWKFSLRERNL